MPPFVREDRPSASWMKPSELEDERFAMKDGKILLGQTKKNTVPIGLKDNRHIMTIAGSRAGKSATSLIPNLLTWVGSTIVVDPKGELATETAKWRAEKLGQDVFILDPFNEVKGTAAQYRKNYNPLDELKFSSDKTIVDDAADMADALIINDPNSKSDHWTLGAKNILRGLILYAVYCNEKKQDGSGTLKQIRKWITSTYEGEGDVDEDEIWLSSIFNLMKKTKAYDGVMAGVGATTLSKHEEERSSILSTAVEQTAFLDSNEMRTHTSTSDLPSIRVLKHKPTTIYLVLPASRMARHYRWLRLVLTLAMTALEREKNKTAHDVLFILEEFPTLGHMQQIETAAGLMAGYGVKLWTVIQDLSQLKTHYPRSWETFIGNSGIIEAFGNTDDTTLEYLSKQLGTSLAKQIQPEQPSLGAQAQGAPHEKETIVPAPLMATHEIAQGFCRDNQNKLVMLAGEEPFILQRIFWKTMINK